MHLVKRSPWPLIARAGVFSVVTILLNRILTKSFWFLGSAVLFLLIVTGLWVANIIDESVMGGFHTTPVVGGLKVGFILFILREVILFFSLFWAFYHFTLAPDISTGGITPPPSIFIPHYLDIPLLNTSLLLLSGVRLTASHIGFESFDRQKTIVYLVTTILLGILFLYFQCIEYYEISFTIMDSSYCSIFFMGTGTHGLHVFLGLCMLLVSIVSISTGYLNGWKGLGFLTSIWYWHFVDVVWLFLNIVFYVT